MEPSKNEFPGIKAKASNIFGMQTKTLPITVANSSMSRDFNKDMRIF